MRRELFYTLKRDRYSRTARLSFATHHRALRKRRVTFLALVNIASTRTFAFEQLSSSNTHSNTTAKTYALWLCGCENTNSNPPSRNTQRE